MRHQKGRRDCSYNSSLRCLSFTRCLSAILCPGFLKNKLHLFFFFFLSRNLPCGSLRFVLLPSCPRSPFPPEAHPYTKARGSWFCLFSAPTHPVPSALWAGLCLLRVLGSGQPPGSSRCCLPAPWPSQPACRASTRGTVALQSSLSFLLPDSLGSPLFSALQRPLL